MFNSAGSAKNTANGGFNMKKKHVCILGAVATVLVIAAAVTMSILYKEELKGVVSSARDKVISLKQKYFCGDEFENYADM